MLFAHTFDAMQFQVQLLQVTGRQVKTRSTGQAEMASGNSHYLARAELHDENVVIHGSNWTSCKLQQQNRWSGTYIPVIYTQDMFPACFSPLPFGCLEAPTRGLLNTLRRGKLRVRFVVQGLSARLLDEMTRVRVTNPSSEGTSRQGQLLLVEPEGFARI